MCPEEGDQDGEWSQGKAIQVAEVTLFLQPGEVNTEGCPHHSQQFPQGGQHTGKVLISLSGEQHWDMRKWNEAMSGISDWTLGKCSSLRGWLVTGIGFPGKRVGSQACQSSRSTWMTPSHMAELQGVGLYDPYWSLLTLNDCMLKAVSLNSKLVERTAFHPF